MFEHIRKAVNGTNISKVWVLFVCVTTCSLIAGAHSADVITIDILTRPIIFSKDVTLVCNIRSDKIPGHLAWYKLPNRQILAVDATSRNPLKYDVEIGYQPSEFLYKLKIKYFGTEDINCTYRCDAGFQSTTKTLQLNDKEYIALPNEHSIHTSLNITDNKLIAKINLRNVYPTPSSCHVDFQGQNMTANISMSLKPAGSFFDLTVGLQFVLVDCIGVMNVSCTFGSKTPFILEPFNKCQHNQANKSHTGIMVIVVVAFTTVLFLVVIATRKGIIVKKQYCRRKNVRYSDVSEI